MICRIDEMLLNTMSLFELSNVVPLIFYLWDDQQVLPESFYDLLFCYLNDTRKNNPIRQIIFWLSKLGVVKSNEYTMRFDRVSNSQVKTLMFVNNLTEKFATLKPGMIFPTLVNDPLFSLPFKLKKIEIKKIFNSSARPVLLDFHYEKFVYEPCEVIFKLGDDLTVDMNVQIMFWVFNVIWENAFVQDVPYIKLYRVMPTGNESGFIEFLPSMSVENYDWDLLKTATPRERNRLILTAAGSFVAIYVLGIRDRHRDNMLINDDYEYIHIDFGFMWNFKTWFDANRFAIPSEFKTILSDEEWHFFLNRCVMAHMYLRRNIGMIQYFCTKLFKSSLWPEDSIIQCIVKSFYLDQSEKAAGEKIYNLILSGLASPKKYIKDWWHSA